MSLEQQINEDIKASMLAREHEKLETIRSIKAAILLAKTSGANHELSDDDIIKIMQKLVKQRRESAALYAQAGRQELADKELLEASFIDVYLPKQFGAEELEAKLKEIIASVGASSPADMGKVMGVASKQLAGRADGRAISEVVKRLLAK